jgi:hypothetical protein
MRFLKCEEEPIPAGTPIGRKTPVLSRPLDHEKKK